MLTTFITWLLAYKYLVLFPVAVIEGPVIAIICGSLAAAGQLNFIVAYAVIIAGDLTGDSLYYTLGRYGRAKVLRRLGHHIGLTEDRVKKVDQHFGQHASKTLVLGKLAFSLEIPVIFSAGLARYPYLRFIEYMAIEPISKLITP